MLRVWDSWGRECAAGDFVFWLWDSWGSECAARGFVVVCVCVCRHCEDVSIGN